MPGGQSVPASLREPDRLSGRNSSSPSGSISASQCLLILCNPGYYGAKCLTCPVAHHCPGATAAIRPTCAPTADTRQPKVPLCCQRRKPVRLFHEPGPEFVGHLRMRRRIHAHCRQQLPCRLALRSVPGGGLLPW